MKSDNLVIVEEVDIALEGTTSVELNHVSFFYINFFLLFFFIFPRRL